GDVLRLGGGLQATALGRYAGAEGTRLVRLRFDRSGVGLWRALYAQGRPVQYSYLRAELELLHAQNRFPARPWAEESPSAGRQLRVGPSGARRRRGVALARLPHAVGLSSTGDAAADALLPLPGRYEIPAATVAAIEGAQRAGGRVVAAGTTVVRALEGSVAAQ